MLQRLYSHVPGSNLGYNKGYPNRFSVALNKYRHNNENQATAALLHILDNHYSSTILLLDVISSTLLTTLRLVDEFDRRRG